MRTPLLVILSLCLTFTPFVAKAEKKIPLTKWQVTISYSSDKDMRIVSAEKFSDPSRRISQPGLNIAVETREARVSWIRHGQLLYSTTAEVPFGNRYGNLRSDGDVAVLRLQGPVDTRTGDVIEMEFVGVKSRYDVPVSEAYSASSRTKLSFKIGELLDAEASRVKYGPYAKSAIATTGPNRNRLTVVLMGDGYRTEEIDSGKYASDAQLALSAFAAKDPWGEILKVTNFWLVKVRSAESGADDPCAPDAALPCTPVSVNTYFNASFGGSGQDRILQLSQKGEENALAAADKYIGSGEWDAIIVFVNSTKYGGTGGAVATTSTDPYAPEIAVHELGHTIGKLADEYDDPYPGYPNRITEINVDSNGSNPKWKAWLTAGAPLPTPDEDAYNDVVGAFEGARYKKSGVFRPMRNCMMRNIGQRFCPVCQEGLLLKVLGGLDLWEKLSPSADSIDVSARARLFKFTPLPLSEGQFHTTWKVCRKVVATEVDSITVRKSSLRSSSSCPVSLRVDYESPRMATYNVYQTRTWTVTK